LRDLANPRSGETGGIGYLRVSPSSRDGDADRRVAFGAEFFGTAGSRPVGGFPLTERFSVHG
jgi:hypothetical protein